MNPGVRLLGAPLLAAVMALSMPAANAVSTSPAQRVVTTPQEFDGPRTTSRDLGGRITGVEVDESATELFVGVAGRPAVLILDAVTLEERRAIAVTADVRALAYERGQLFATLTNDTVVQIDTPTGDVVGTASTTLALRGAPVGDVGVSNGTVYVGVGEGVGPLAYVRTPVSGLAQAVPDSDLETPTIVGNVFSARAVPRNGRVLALGNGNQGAVVMARSSTTFTDVQSAVMVGSQELRLDTGDYLDRNLDVLPDQGRAPGLLLSPSEVSGYRSLDRSTADVLRVRSDPVIDWPLFGCAGPELPGPGAVADVRLHLARGSLLCSADFPIDVARVVATVRTAAPTDALCVDAISRPDTTSSSGVEVIRTIRTPVVDGRAAFDAWIGVSGSWYARMWDCGTGANTLIYIDGDGASSATRQVTLSQRESTMRFDGALTVASRVSGMVRDARTGRPYPGVEVYSIPGNGFGLTPSPSVLTDDDGHYVLGSLSSGSHVIVFVAPNGDVEYWPDRAPQMGEVLEIGPAEDVPDIDAALGALGVQRIAGSDRFATAAAFSEAAFAPGGADTAFVSTGRNFPDALAATPLAAAAAAPILLVDTDAVPDVTAAELRRLGVTRIVVVGGPAAVSENVVEQLRDFGDVSRVAGVNRFDTAAQLVATGFPEPAPLVFVATGENFPDALATGATAGVTASPLLLTAGVSLPAETRVQLQRLQPELIVLVGGPTAVSDAVLAELNGLATDGALRLSGTTRYETAATLAEVTFDPGIPTAFVATGRNFPDALAAGAVAGLIGAPVLLSEPDGFASASRTAGNNLRVAEYVVLGGPTAIGDAVISQLDRTE